MSSGLRPSLFFLHLPDLKQLCSIRLTLQEEEEELRTRQIQTCRELVLLYSEVLASPDLDSFADITAVMAIQFFQRGLLQVFALRCRAELGRPQEVSPGVLQTCLSYALTSRLAPSWNKAGPYLLSGRDFLTESGRLNAVSMELSASEDQLCISIEASAVRLPPTSLDDFDLPPALLRWFCSDADAVLHPPSGGAVWCHVLPSMKKGQIITISRRPPPDGPFRTYRDLQIHWRQLYGYSLPDLPEQDVVYCSVYFRLVGQKLFTYPLSCIRLQPLQHCPPLHLQGALGSFLSDLRSRLETVCGLPAPLTRKPRYCSVSLSSAATLQTFTEEQVDLISSCSSSSTQLPPLPPPHVNQPPPWTPLLQQDGAQRILGHGCGSRSNLTEDQGADEDWPFSSSSSSSSHVAPNSAPLNSQSAPSSSSILPPLPPLPPLPKLVPVFRNKHRWRHVSVGVLKEQQQQLSGGEEEKRRRRVTLPPSSSAVSFSIPAPPLVPRFQRGPRPAPAAGLSRLQHVSKPRPIPPPKLEVRFKSRSSPKKHVKQICESKTSANSSEDVLETQPPAADAPPAPASDASRAGVKFNLKKKQRSAVRVEDVEKMARNNQLWKLNAATLLLWLKTRGVTVSGKLRKEELMLKVMGRLAEA